MQKDESANSIVATFSDRTLVDAAVCELHGDGFRHTWLAHVEHVDPNTFGGAGGTVGAGREIVQPIGENPLVQLFRRGGKPTLYDALREHGLSDEDAKNVDGAITEGDYILVVEDANDPVVAEEIIVNEGGSIVAAPTPLGTEPDRETLREQRQHG
ncbi:MAG: hypothetical protein JO036_10795 [Candidatus Eremiobacteraeota bacterium]|nr:hypothetical protein [Candidatus Eremiobacteraeota bacterium]